MWHGKPFPGWNVASPTVNVFGPISSIIISWNNTPSSSSYGSVTLYVLILGSFSSPAVYESAVRTFNFFFRCHTGYIRHVFVSILLIRAYRLLHQYQTFSIQHGILASLQSFHG